MVCGPRGHPGGKFVLKNTKHEIINYELPNYKIRLYCGTYAYSFIGIYIGIETKKELTIYPNVMKIIYKDHEINYDYDLNSNYTDQSIIHIDRQEAFIYYHSTPLIKLSEDEQIKIVAANIIFDGKQYFSIDTLTFIVK